MPTSLAASCALGRSREAIAVTVVYWPNCMAGMTFLRPMAAVLSTPQRNFFDMAFIIEPRFGTRTPPGPHSYHERGTPRARNHCNFQEYLSMLFITP